MKKKDNYILLIIIIGILIGVLGLLFFNKEKEVINKNDEITYKILDNYSRFFTIDSIVYKYITLLSSNNTSELLKVLDDDFVRNNNIIVDNLFNYVEYLNGTYTFKTKKVLYEDDSKNVVKYYVYGYLIEDIYATIGVKKDYYVIVNVDLKNQLFSISPYNGEIFKEVK